MHETEFPGLYACSPERMPFGRDLWARAFLLRRDAGNLIVYSTSLLDEDFDAIGRLGGVSRQYLNHWHEAMFASDLRAGPLFVHERDMPSVESRLPVAGTFAQRHFHGPDFEVIPTPGHTRGATAFLWRAGGHRMLFTGDTLYLDGGEWGAAVLSSSDRASYVRSLELIRELEFDVLVPWAAAGATFLARLEEGEAHSRVTAVLERVRDGATW